MYTGAMENDTRPAIILQHIHSALTLVVELSLQGLVTYENEGIGSKGVLSDDILVPEEALQMCTKLQKSLEQAFISLYSVNLSS